MLPPKRREATFGGVTFSGFVKKHFPERLTVPVPDFRTILRSGRVRVICDYKMSDDYAADAAGKFNRGTEVSMREVESYLADKPDRLYLDIDKNVIRFQPSQNVSFTVTEVDVKVERE